MAQKVAQNPRPSFPLFPDQNALAGILGATLVDLLRPVALTANGARVLPSQSLGHVLLYGCKGDIQHYE